MATTAAGIANGLRKRAINCMLSATLRSTTRRNRDLANVAPRLFRHISGGDKGFTGGRALRPSWLCYSPGLHGQELAWKTPSISRSFSSDAEPPHQKIAMPALSPTMTQGNVVNWKKNQGDEVMTGDVLCEIETDKATLDLEAMEDGFFAKALVPAGSKDIPVGQPLCIVVEEKEDVDKFANYSEGPSTPEPPERAESKQPEPEEKTPTQADSSPTPDVPHQNIAMPALSPTMTQGNVLRWKKEEGEQVSAGDVLCEIETDKATLDMEAMEDGYLAKILVQAGSKDIPVGQSLCIVVEEEEDVGKFKDYTGEAPSKAGDKKADPGKEAKSSEPISTPSAVPSGPKKDRMGPSVRRYLAESGLDASTLSGTGPHGMLLKGDILAAIKSGPPPQKKSSKDSKPTAKPDTSTPSPPKPPPKAGLPLLSEEPHDDIPNTQIRKIIAARLLESKTQIPHLYLSADAILDPTLQLRKNLKEKHGTSVSVNDFVIRATALALREVPEANAFWDEKSGDIVLNKSIDISVAVATDKGLMTPILKDADQKSLSVISAEVKSLAERARAGKLKPQEFQGGTFSISNLGMFPVDRFCAIINPPQACILAVGKGEKSVQWTKNGDTLQTVTKMGLTLSADHRVFDGDVGGRFLKALTTNLTDPKNMLL